MAHVKLATGLTFPNIRAGLDPQVLDDFNAWLVSKGISPVVEGDPNPIHNDLFGFQSDGVCRVRRGSGMNDEADVGPINNTDWLPNENTEMFMAAGGQWDGLQIYWQIPGRDVEVPADLPYRSYFDENNEEQIHTWETWGGSGRHEIFERGGKLYRSDAVNNTIGFLTLTYALLSSLALPWLTVSEFNALNATQTETE